MARHGRVRAHARELVDRTVDRGLQQFVRARAALDRGDVDVLVLGESSCLSHAEHDTDRRMIPALLAEQLGGARVVTIARPGYGARTYADMLGVLAQSTGRPGAVVLAVNIRTITSTTVLRHPVFSYPRTHAALARVTPGRPAIRPFGVRNAPSATDYAVFRKVPMETRWRGGTTVDDFRSRLEGNGPHPWPTETEALLFDYFHGEPVLPSNPGLGHLGGLSRRIEEYGVPTVAFWAMPPLARGELHYPGEFEGHVRRNLGAVTDALVQHTSLVGDLIEPDVTSADFQDERNGTEHYATSGRQTIARQLADRVRSRQPDVVARNSRA